MRQRLNHSFASPMLRIAYSKDDILDRESRSSMRGKDVILEGPLRVSLCELKFIINKIHLNQPLAFYIDHSAVRAFKTVLN